MSIEGKLCNWMKVVVGGGGGGEHIGEAIRFHRKRALKRNTRGLLGFCNIMEGTGSDFSVELTEGNCRMHVNTTVDFMHHISLWKTP